MVLAHYNDGAYLILAASCLAGLVLVLVLSWRDSLKSIREFFSPLRAFKRPRFRLIHLFVTMVVVSAAVKLATLRHWSTSNWIGNVGLMATSTLIFSLGACFIWIFCSDMFGRRRKSKSSVIVQLPKEDADEAPVKRENLKIRFPETKRQITAFRR